MNLSQQKAYLASPLFTPAQNATLDVVEAACKEISLPYFSPRDFKVGGETDLSKMAPEQRKIAARKIFQANIDNMDDSTIILVCVDDRDVGTYFEAGYFVHKNFAEGDKLIVTYSANGFGLNIMLNDASHGHFSNLEDLQKFLLGLNDYEGEYHYKEVRSWLTQCAENPTESSNVD